MDERQDFQRLLEQVIRISEGQVMREFVDGRPEQSCIYQSLLHKTARELAAELVFKDQAAAHSLTLSTETSS